MSKPIRKLKLTEHQLMELDVCYHRTTSARVARRVLCILLKAQGRTHAQIADTLFVSINTVTRWVQIYVAAGLEALCRCECDGDPGELTEEQLSALKEELRHKTYRSAKDVAHYIEGTFHVQYTERGAQALLHRLGLTFHKSALVQSRANLKDQIAFVEQYRLLRNELGKDDLIYFVDAAHLIHNVLTGYGWAFAGERPVFPTNSGRNRINVLGAYSPVLGEYVGLESRENINAETLKELVQKILELHPESPRIVLIVDNARYNHARLLRDYVADTPIEMIYLPPYSPNLNLIERLWNFFKDQVMRDHFYETFQEFVAAVKSFFANWSIHRSALQSLMTENFHLLHAT